MKSRRVALMGLAVLVLGAACGRPPKGGAAVGPRTEISRSALLDKIKGGWAGQVIGCTFGGPTEFRYPGAMILDYQTIPWDDTIIARRFERSPGLYDDVYMDLTFVEVMAREGIDAPAAKHAQAFAHAGYPLWHANQAARYNILNGLLPPDSGHWRNSPHADDIDFQIEADFAGLMSPGMVNAGAAICGPRRPHHELRRRLVRRGLRRRHVQPGFRQRRRPVRRRGGLEGPAAAIDVRPLHRGRHRLLPGRRRPTGRGPGSRSSAAGPRTSAVPISSSIPGTSTPGSTGLTSSSASSTVTAISPGRSRSRRGAARTRTAIRRAPGGSWGRCSAMRPSPRSGRTRSRRSRTSLSRTRRCPSTRSTRRA